MKSIKKCTLLIGGIMIALFGITLSASFVLAPTHPPEDASTGPVPALAVETMDITAQNSFDLRRVFSGRVQARQDSVLGFEQSGRLASVQVEEGTVVRQGDLLAILDTKRLEARRAELIAALAEADARLALASATLQRKQEVLKAGGVSRQGLDEAREGRRVAVAAVDLAHRRIASIDVELAKSRLTAPFNGTIVERLADEGRVLDAGDPVLRLQANTTPEIRIGVAGNSVDTLHAGQIYTLNWQGLTLPARMRAILPLRAATARTVDALFDPIDSHKKLRPGDLVTLHLASPINEPGMWLPMTALTEGERGLWNVYVIEPALADEAPAGLAATHRVMRRTVDLIYQEADKVYVQGTFTQQDRVITTGLHRVVPGQWVRQAPEWVAYQESGHE